jgi:lipopolysaccharide/colanic/teichoic acid biosynthesis glycosyltransferase
VNGRNIPSWEERLEMDVWYVENQSFLLDCRIILKTVGRVFSTSGVSAKGQATVEPFKGSPKE